MNKNRPLILAVSSKKEWFSNITSRSNNKKYEYLFSKNGKEALEIFAIKKPKIVLIDKYLSDMKGTTYFQNILSLKNCELPIIVFIDFFATKSEIRKAIDLGADYFLYEGSLDTLKFTLETQLQKRKRILEVNKKEDLSFKKLHAKDSSKNVSAKYTDYLFLDDKDKPGFYAIKDFIYISSLKDYTQIHTTQNKIITLHKTLNFWEGFLPSNKFLRIHRQTIINLDHVERVENNNSYRYNIYLQDVGIPFAISQRYSKKLKNGWGVKKIE